MKEKQKKLLDIVMLGTLPILAVIISYLINANFLLSTVFFFGIPSVYLSLRTRHQVLHAFVFSGCFTFFGVLFMDHLAVINKAWHVPTIFSFRIFGSVPVEDIVWAFLQSYFIVIFYEHFFDKTKHKLVAPHMKYFMYLAIPIFIMFLFLIALNSPLLYISYIYLKLGLILGFLPLLGFLISFPKYILTFLKTAPYFFFVGLIHEIVGLQLGHWSFLGNEFLGWVTIFGQRFPYEELFFWLMTFAVSVLAYYEFFDDENLFNKKIR